MAAQTTTQSEATAEQPLRNLEALLAELQDLRARNKALERRVKHLEFILAQRSKITKNRYRELQKHFESMKAKIMKIFLENIGCGLSYSQIYQQFRLRYPYIPCQNLNRRIRELTAEEKLWTTPDPISGRQRFFLKLDLLNNSKGESINEQ